MSKETVVKKNDPRSWQAVLELHDATAKRSASYDGSAFVPALEPALLVAIDYQFRVALKDGPQHLVSGTFGIGRYPKTDQAELTKRAAPWREPSEHFEIIMADLRSKLETMLRDVLPWDGEL